MSFSKNDLEIIKTKITLSSEIEKKTKVIKKGNDYWCCCLFHEEKTPSCKINNDLGSYYCFGCGAKGDIFTLYTELYNYNFPDAVKELAQRAGIKITESNYGKNSQIDKIYKIHEVSTNWFQKNLLKSEDCQKYLDNRLISQNTINVFRIGYSSNKQSTLYEYLKSQNFNDEDIFKSNLVKKDDNNKIRDFFYKRLIFPIANEQNKIIGFGGRVLNNSNPKYINSPESFFFKKRNILYNLNNAKNIVRKKNNILLCEGYMDVISLYENNIKTAVAPLGTALTDMQLLLSWKYVNKPTIMFDGDNAGLRASYKAALMALPHLSPNRYLQFINLPKNSDPDNFLSQNSFSDFIQILKKPTSLTKFIFDYSSSSIDLKDPDNKITYDKYLDDIINTIKDSKIRYFYKNEFKNLFFKKIKTNAISKKNNKLPNLSSLKDLQLLSFLSTFLNHISIRKDLYKVFEKSNIFSNDQQNLLKYFNNTENLSKEINEIDLNNVPSDITRLIQKSMENKIFQLFPYSNKQFKAEKALEEVQESIKNLNTRLSNLKKINKSLDDIENNELSWSDLQNLGTEVYSTKDSEEY